MAERTLTSDTWQERETLRHALAGARCDIGCAADCVKHSLNAKERAREYIRERPLAAALTTLAVGLVASRLVPALLWRSRGSLFRRFTGELVKGAAGMMLPVLTARLAASLRPRHEPRAIVLTGGASLDP
jgi:hypothetical protein